MFSNSSLRIRNRFDGDIVHKPGSNFLSTAGWRRGAAVRTAIGQLTAVVVSTLGDLWPVHSARQSLMHWQVEDLFLSLVPAYYDRCWMADCKSLPV